MKLKDCIFSHLFDLEVSVTKGTLAVYKNALNQFSGSLPADTLLNGVKTEHIAAHLRALHKSGRKGVTIAKHADIISAFFAWAVANSFIRHSPYIPKRLPKIVCVPYRKKIISHDQHQKIIALLKSPECKLTNPRMWLLVCEIAFRTSLRVSDVFNLKWSNVDLDAGTISVTPLKTKRFNTQVVIPMDRELHRLLEDHCARPYKNFGNSPYVIPEGQWYFEGQPSAYRSTFRRILRKAGVFSEGMSFHSYRHSLVSRLANQGVSPIVIQSITGHSLEQIKTYTHVTIDTQRAALELVNNPNGHDEQYQSPPVNPVSRTTDPEPEKPQRGQLPG